nr:uncharacterized protein LOC127297716 isoform X2 [Lolium perenne]
MPCKWSPRRRCSFSSSEDSWISKFKEKICRFCRLRMCHAKAISRKFSANCNRKNRDQDAAKLIGVGLLLLTRLQWVIKNMADDNTRNLGNNTPYSLQLYLLGRSYLAT